MKFRQCILQCTIPLTSIWQHVFQEFPLKWYVICISVANVVRAKALAMGACRDYSSPLRWRHNDYDGVSNHQPHGCLLNRLFRRRSKKTPKLCVTGLCVGNSPGPLNSPHKWPVTRRMFPFDDVIMVRIACMSVIAGWLKSLWLRCKWERLWEFAKNSLCPFKDAIWTRRFIKVLDHIKACCLMAANLYLIQCWPGINKMSRNTYPFMSNGNGLGYNNNMYLEMTISKWKSLVQMASECRLHGWALLGGKPASLGGQRPKLVL